MMQDKSDILRRHREDIGQNIGDIDSVVSKLTDYKVITKNLEEKILSKPTRIHKCRELLNILPMRGDSGFDMFYKVLKECGEEEAAKYLDRQHQLPSVFFDPNDDPQIVIVKKCTTKNGNPMYEKYKTCTTEYSLIYQMNSNPRGLCLVINNQIFDEALEPRDGTEKDVESLEKLFRQLHFEIIVHNNQTAKDIDKLVEVYKNYDHSNYNCFVLVILSHGSNGNILGVDGEEVEIDKIVNSFVSNECKSLCGKPKLFFIQACQGEQEDLGTSKSHENTDQVNELVQKLDKLDLHAGHERVDARKDNIANRADIFIAMSTFPGFVSWRDIKKGTWFIQAVVYAFKYWAHSCELVNLMTKVNSLVQKAETVDSKKQSPVWRTSLGKSLYFFPGLVQQEAIPNVTQPRNQQHPNNPSATSTIVPNKSSFRV